jgi:hypothetical protein
MRPRFLMCGLVAAAVLTGCGNTTVIKTVTSEPAKPVTKTAAPAAGGAAPALLGDLLTVDAHGTTLKVRATRVIDPLPAGEYDTPAAGKRYVGVEIAVKNVGDRPYTDSVANGATLVLKDDEQADATIVSGGQCSDGFSTDVKIAAGDKRVGCIAFEIPSARSLRAFQFTPDSGFADQTGQWRLPSIKPTSTSAPATTAAPDSVPPTAPGTAAAFKRCDANISASTSTTTCGFAQNVFYEYWNHNGDGVITVYSPATHTTWQTYCTPDAGQVVCETDDGGVVKFSQSALANYSQDQADAYAASHDIGE